jgi:hypothetical protein
MQLLLWGACCVLSVVVVLEAMLFPPANPEQAGVTTI